MEFHRSDGVTVTFNYLCAGQRASQFVGASADDGSWHLGGSVPAPEAFAALLAARVGEGP